MSFDTDVLQRLCTLMEQQVEETRALRRLCSDVNQRLDAINAHVEQTVDGLKRLWESHESLRGSFEPSMHLPDGGLRARIDALETRVERLEAEQN